MFPERVYKGDTLQTEWASEADNGSLALRLRADIEESANEVASMIDGGFAVSLDTSGLTAGLWSFHVSEVDGEVTRTVAAGVIEIADALSPAKTHNEKMVALLETLSEGKVEGRGDVTFYTLGDRQVQAASFGDIFEALQRYRYAVQRERMGERRAFWYG